MPLSNYDWQEWAYAFHLTWKWNGHLGGDATGVYIIPNMEFWVSKMSCISLVNTMEEFRMPTGWKLIYSMSWQDCNLTDQRDTLWAKSSRPFIAQDNLHAVCFDSVSIVSNKVSNKINILQPTQFITLMHLDVQLLQLYFTGARGLRALQIAKKTSDSRKPWHSLLFGLRAWQIVELSH
jgi:hypothetical protein